MITLRQGEYMSFPMLRKSTGVKCEVFTQLLFETIENQTGVTKEELKSTARNREISDIRAIFIYMVSEKYEYISQGKLGSMVNRDHATVIYNIKKFKSLITSDTSFKEAYFKIRGSLNSRLQVG